MKFFFSGALLASFIVLAGCAGPASNTSAIADAAMAPGGETFEDKGELLTGSRIPQKSTAHVLKRVGSAEYKKAKADSNSGNVTTSGASW